MSWFWRPFVFLQSTFFCECEDGYTGSFCEEFDACHSRPCRHNGTCTDIKQGVGGGSFTCTCPSGVFCMRTSLYLPVSSSTHPSKSTFRACWSSWALLAFSERLEVLQREHIMCGAALTHLSTEPKAAALESQRKRKGPRVLHTPLISSKISFHLQHLVSDFAFVRVF